jgi:DNA polymerase III subunit alpha
VRESLRDGDRVTLGGMLSQIKRLRTKKGDPMAFANLEDIGGMVELVLFSDVLEEAGETVENDNVVLVKGRVEHKDGGRTSMLVSSIEMFDPSEEEIEAADQEAEKVVNPGAVRVRLDAAAVLPDVIEDLKDVLVSFPGESAVVIELKCSERTRELLLSEDYKVARSAGLYSELSQLLGSALIPAAA